MMPNELSFADFARLLGVKPQAVTALRKDDRLVLTTDGKRVVVDASRARIAATADPTKAGVTARHAAERQAKGAGQAAPVPSTTEAAGGEGDAADEPAPSQGFQYWRERNERAKALASERENDLADGKLLAADEVTAAVAQATTTLRASLERLPDTLAPELAAANDEGQVRGLLAEAIEHALEDLARQFGELGKGAVA